MGVLSGTHIRAKWLINWLFSLVLLSHEASAQSPDSEAYKLPEQDGLIHLGVASCASSVCHGKTTASNASNVLQTEYSTWTRFDRHARAYKTLLSPASKRMARLLDIGPAHKAALCLDCHSDNVKAGLRGRRFQISDGVGCEACHGGAENWIESHTNPEASHDQNITAGLYPTDDALYRAKLCMSCHVGTPEKFASHDIMGAGHPRLSFELDTFSVLQPAHYRVDADYIERKGGSNAAAIWLTGQVTGAEHWLGLLRKKLVVAQGVFPELSLFDCHACHHAMSDVRGQSGLIARPGAIRLNDAPLQLIDVLMQVFVPAQQKQWREANSSLIRAASEKPSAVNVHIDKMEGMLLTLKGKLKSGAAPKQLRRVLGALIDRGLQASFHDYGSSEQLAMAISALSEVLQLNRTLSKPIEQVYKSLNDEDSFQAARFESAMAKLSKAWSKLP